MTNKVANMLYTLAQRTSTIVDEDYNRRTKSCEEQCKKALEVRTEQAFFQCMRICEAYQEMERGPK